MKNAFEVIAETLSMSEELADLRTKLAAANARIAELEAGDKLVLDFMAHNACRLTEGDKWMVRNDTGHQLSLSVYQRQFGKARTIALYNGDDLAVALRVLRADEE